MSKGLKLTLTLVSVFIIELLILLFIIFVFAISISLCERNLNAPKYDLMIAIALSAWFILSALILLILIKKSTYKLPYKLSFIVIGLFIVIFNKSLIKGFKYEYAEFNSEEWNSESYMKWNLAPGIINRGDLNGKCKPEIEKYLGKPYENIDDVWVYDLAFGSLIINFKNDCFTNAFITCQYKD